MNWVQFRDKHNLHSGTKKEPYRSGIESALNSWLKSANEAETLCKKACALEEAKRRMDILVEIDNID